MRSSTWLPFGFALLLPATAVLGACGPDVETVPTGGSGGSTTTTTGGGGTGGTTGGTGGVGATGGTGGTGGVGATGGTGGTGGFLPPDNDACNGELVAVTVDAPTLTVNGTLNGATDNYQTFCADTTPGADNADVVYQFDVPSDVTASFKIDATGFNPAISLRRQDCSSRFNGDACLIGDGSAVETSVALEAGPAWIVVDSGDGQTGDFTLDVQFTTPKCGDGVINAGEKCDPATPIDDDGCINPGTPNECNFGEPPPDPALVACPGGLITIGKGDAFQLGLFNNGSGGTNHQNVVDATDCVSPAIGPEHIFNVKPTGDGVLTAQIGHWEDGVSLYCEPPPPNPAPECGDFIMYLRKGACSSPDAADQLACADFTLNPNSPFGYDELLTINVPVTGGTDYWLFVDGLDDMYGVGGYYLQISLQ